MTLESLDRLRERVSYLRTSKLLVPSECKVLMRYVDEAEAEIAEKYMELPVDADGVPIRPGDELEYCSKDITHVSGANLGNVSGRTRVAYIAFDCEGCIAIQDEDDEENGELPAFFRSHDDMNYRHTKPDKLKELLKEFGEKPVVQGHQYGLAAPGMIDEFCQRIREMAEEGEL